ncbi:probable L-type lectin-domain containing receptor kinase S.5 [Telopea speciosissima]|uniref:probable L-type lectin-domain containing receptor kinase S.5 n=1 Tax=Telopea speciosissima TaxID=54955 RepID=UPI001CC4D39E|nr:probable L-type lectin-domain containing receptor kinase S.5 [Telopea speciosissima]
MITPGNSASIIVFISLLLFPAPTSSAKQSTNFTFNSFDPSQYGSVFDVIGDASISTQALQITTYTLNDAFGCLNQSGRVMFSVPFKLWEESSSSTDSDIVASFNSTFLINIYRPFNESVGEGFAFVIAPELNIPSASYGQWLGLTNATLDGNPSNKIVAIEFDTVKQEFDPDDNHMGLDIYSVKSSRTVSLSKFGIQIAPEVAKNYTVWIQYDGRVKLMKVYMGDSDSDKPSSPVLNEKINLKDYVSQYSYIGFSASTGVQAQLNSVFKWDLSVEVLPHEKNLSLVKIVIGVGVACLALFGIFVFGLVHHLKKWRDRDNDPNILGLMKSLPGTPKELKFKDLKKATNNFDEKLKLGQGGFGVVYKGFLERKNFEVAVKRFSRESMKGIDDYLAELTIINRLRHKHLVRLIGWCHEKGLLLLVYDYMPNGSLDNHLFGGPEKLLNWERRYKIIADVASGQHYLHDEYDEMVIHRDLKASNIMLDSNFNARLGDFGLARALDKEKNSYAEVEGFPGTLGYVAPECFRTCEATTESDVFGFAAVVLEVVCSKRPWTKIAGTKSLVDWAWTLYREGRIFEAVDKRLKDEYDAQQAHRLLLVGLACSHPVASQRPKMPTIVLVISGSVPPPDVPHIKPDFVPALGFNIESLITETQDTTAITSSYYGSVNSESIPRCHVPQSFVSCSDVSLV